MTRRTVILFVLTAFSFVACNEGNSEFVPQYFDVKSVIENSIKFNKISKSKYNKTVWINDKKDVISTEITNWEKELEIFLLADLNKKDYLNKFSKDSTNKTITYQIKPNTDAQITKLTIRFSNQKPVEIIANLETKNFLYHSKRDLNLRFEANKLIRYEVKGWQQLFIGDKKSYHLISEKM